MKYETSAHIEMSRIFGIFTNKQELMHQIGANSYSPLAAKMLKELLDNAIDAGASALEVWIDEYYFQYEITIKDNGGGLSTETIKALHPSKFVSSKRFARRPERGRKGNALITIIGLLSLNNEYTEIINKDGLHEIKFVPDYAKETFKVEYFQNKEIAHSPGTVVRFKLNRNSYKRELQGMLRCLFALILLNPDKAWKVYYNQELLVTHRPRKLAKAYEPQKYLDGDIFWYRPDEFYQKLTYEAEQIYKKRPLSCRAWLKKHFLRMSKIVLPEIAHKKITKITKKEAFILFNALREELQKPPSHTILWHIGKETMIETFKELLPLVERFTEFKKEEFIDTRYALFYPKQIKDDALLEEPALTFKLEILVAAFKHFQLREENVFDEENFYIVGINGTLIDLQSEIGDLIPTGFDISLKMERLNKFKSGKYSYLIIVHLITPLDVFAELSKTSGSIELFNKDQLRNIIWNNERLNGNFNLSKEVVRLFKYISKEPTEASGESVKEPMKECLKHNLQKILEEAGDMEKGIPPTIRQAYYVFRKHYNQLTGKDVNYKTFEKYVYEIERKKGTYLFLRDQRGHLYVPHRRFLIGVDLNTHKRLYKERRLFQNILFIEKEGYREILEAYKLPERYDLAVLYGKGFGTEGISLLIEKLFEMYKKIRMLVLHDADPHGYMIFLDLKQGSWFKGREHQIEFIDMGLNVREGLRLGLQTESLIEAGEDKKKLKQALKQLKSFLEKPLPPKLNYFYKDYEFFSKEKKRIELNAFPVKTFMVWLEEKLKKHGIKKVVPTTKEIRNFYEDCYDEDDILKQTTTEVLWERIGKVVFEELKGKGIGRTKIDFLKIKKAIRDIVLPGTGKIDKSWEDILDKTLKEKIIREKVKQLRGIIEQVLGRTAS